MNYEEYKEILDDALIAYINNGGSLYHMSSVTTEYVFDYDDKNIAYEDRKRLEDAAIKAIIGRRKLPEGIQLIKCILHGKDRYE